MLLNTYVIAESEDYRLTLSNLFGHFHWRRIAPALKAALGKLDFF